MGRKKTFDIAAVAALPDDALVIEDVLAALEMSSVKTVQKKRAEGLGCPWVKLGRRSIRYRMGDIRRHLAGLPVYGTTAAVTGGTAARTGQGGHNA